MAPVAPVSPFGPLLVTVTEEVVGEVMDTVEVVVVRLTMFPSLSVTVIVFPDVVETVTLIIHYKDLDTSALTIKPPLSIVVWVSAPADVGKID